MRRGYQRTKWPVRVVRNRANVPHHAGMGGNRNTWDEALEDFRTWCTAAGRSPGTIKLRVSYLERLAAGAGCDPWSVTEDMVTAFVGCPSWSPETRKSARASVRTFYAWAVTTGRIPTSPAERLPTVRVPRGLPHPTPEDCLEEALRGASERDKLMLMLAAYAGLRRAEIAGLTWEDIGGGRDGDLAGRVIRVRGKGGRVRPVPMHERLFRQLVIEFAARREGRLSTGHRYGFPTSPYLFPGQGDGPITPGAVGAILKRATKAPGHGLRHRFATRAYAGTKDLRAVQELLGHTRPETTAIYTLVPDEALRAAVNAA